MLIEVVGTKPADRMSSDALNKPPEEPECVPDKGDIASPPMKRMKQARLPFKPLGQKILPPVQTVTKDCKKRKLSDPESPVAKQPKSTKSPLVEKPLPKITCPENDNEVSSSSEADVHCVAGIPKPAARKIYTLERFVCPVRKEEDITSTNEVVDLTDENCRDGFQTSVKTCSVDECDGDKLDQPMAVDEPMEVGGDKENQLGNVCSSSKCDVQGDNRVDNVTKIIEQVASGELLVCVKNNLQNSLSKEGKTEIVQVLQSGPAILACSEISPVATDKTAVTTGSANTQSADNSAASASSVATVSSVASSQTGKVPENGLKAYFVKTGVADNNRTVLTAVPQIETVDLCNSTSEQSDHEESQMEDSTRDATEPESPVQNYDPSECSSKENSPGGDSPRELSSSFMSPQTADDSFRKVTSAGSTPRSSKPRSKLSSAKKVEREALRQKRKAEKEKELEEKKRLKEEVRAEKEKLRKEEREKKEEERLQKEQEKQEKKQQLEHERLERQQQKDEEKRKKQEVLDAKMEEKKKKDDEKYKMEEEKRLKEEEKQKEEEERLNKKKKMQQKFQSFFTKSKNDDTQLKANETTGPFMPFELKKDMKLAPKNMFEISDVTKETLGKLLHSQDTSQLYLGDVKSGKRQPQKSRKSGTERGDEDILVLGHDSEVVKKVTYHVKLIQFHTNHRPPYYGTWRKTSKSLSSRNPWKMDSSLLDYEVDSDDEWEEEEPGESLSASEGEEEKDDKEEGEEEEDDGFMVPHGYLSEDEGCEQDEEVTIEVLKARRAAKQASWESECKRQCHPQMAVVLGCYWVSNETPNPGGAFEKLMQYKLTVCCEPETTIATSLSKADNAKPENAAPVDGGMDKLGSLSASGNRAQKKPVPEEAMPDLLRMVHGNTSGMKRLVDEFRLYWKKRGQQGTTEDTQQPLAKEEQMEVEEEPGESNAPPTENLSSSAPPTENLSSSAPPTQGLPTSVPPKIQEDNDSSDKANEDEYAISKRQMEMKIAAIAVREKRSTYKKICWYVQDSILKQYNLEDLPIPTTWQYVSIPNKRENVNPDSLNTSGRKTPNSKMFSMLASPQQSSPGEGKSDKNDIVTKRANDQWSIKFFTKAKEGIAKDSTIPEHPGVVDDSPKSNPTLTTPEPMVDDCRIIGLEPSPQQKNNNQQAVTFFAQLKGATANDTSTVDSLGNGSTEIQECFEACAKPEPIRQHCPIIISSRPQTNVDDLSLNNVSSGPSLTLVNDEAVEGRRSPDVIFLD